MKRTDYYEQIAKNLGHLHKKITRIQGEILKQEDVSLMEYHILIIISKMQKASQNDLVRELDVDKALISRQIQSMEQKGLINCTCDPECRRQKVLTMTERAYLLLPRLEDIHRECLEHIFGGLDENQLDEMNCFLKGLNSTV